MYKSLNSLVSLGEKRIATELGSSRVLDYHVGGGAMLGRYQKYTPKPPNIAELHEDCLAIDTK